MNCHTFIYGSRWTSYPLTLKRLITWYSANAETNNLDMKLAFDGEPISEVDET